MSTILVTGINGLLGSYLLPLLTDAGHRVIGIGKGEQRIPGDHPLTYYNIDINDQMGLMKVFEKERPDFVIHAAAITQIDQCELDQAVCEDVNVKGTANLLLCTEDVNSHFIFLSTDFVFDGERGNYSEDDLLNPLSWYGFTKVQAEGMVEMSDIPWTIVRTCLVYGLISHGSRSNIVSWIRQSLESGTKIKVVADQIRTPTFAADLAKGILQIVEKKARGIYHLSGNETLSPYQMAEKIAALFSLDISLVESVTASTFTQPAKRPPKTGFNIGKAMSELGFAPVTFTEGLKIMYPQ